MKHRHDCAYGHGGDCTCGANTGGWSTGDGNSYGSYQLAMCASNHRAAEAAKAWEAAGRPGLPKTTNEDTQF